MMLHEMGIKEAIAKRLGTGYQVDIYRKKENNGIIRNGFSIRKYGQGVSAIVYPPRVPDDLNLSMEEFVELLLKDYFKQMLKVHPIEDLRKEDRESFLKKIIPVLVNYESNVETLKDRPHRRFLDLAVQYRYVLETRDGSFVVSKAIAEYKGITEEMLYKAAMGNSENVFCINTLQETINNLFPYHYTEDGPTLALVGTNQKCAYGAAIMINDKSLRKMSLLFGGDFLVIPSSIHEIIAVPYDPDTIRDIRGMVGAVNMTLDKCDILSNSVYRYNAAEKRMSIA